jgi:hypothetical protein
LLYYYEEVKFMITSVKIKLATMTYYVKFVIELYLLVKSRLLGNFPTLVWP